MANPKTPSAPAKSPYPTPGPLGGRLIRDVVGFIRSQNVQLPITSHILIAVSGGSDSVALAHLLVHYGRRIVPCAQISLLHINHRWRAQESDSDERFVKNLGKTWGIPVITKRLKPPSLDSKDSWEELARNARKRIYRQLGGPVFTAHHADDLAETLLWRIFTGAAQTHGGGVAFHHGIEMRPVLKIRKAQLKAYLNEVKQPYQEDASNLSERFLRARMRMQLMPIAEKLFPKMVEHLVKLGLEAQKSAVAETETDRPVETLIQAAGLKLRRAHWNTIFEKTKMKKPWYGEIHLPQGWVLKCQKSSVPSERWVLERFP